MACLACRVRRYCYEHGLTYSDPVLARALGVEPKTLMLWLRNKGELPASALARVDEVIGDSSSPGLSASDRPCGAGE